MSITRRPYSGRLIFDHFPKTAGQAINAWLTGSLGDATVSSNLIGGHKELISCAGDYPIICGHVHFAEAEGFDPRFQYVTLLREPLDRTVSWLFFVIRNHERNQLPGLYEEVETFLASDGDDLGPRLAPAIINPMVAHYAKILGSMNASQEDLVETALRAIQSYDCVGIYERLDEFVAGLGDLIGIPAPPKLQPVNVTMSRPARDEILPKLRERLLAITELDRQLYERVALLVDERLAAHAPRPPKKSKWASYDRQPVAPQTTSSFTMHSARPMHSEPKVTGGVMKFELEFELHEPVEQLQAGFHIFDDRNRRAYGVNNMMLEQPLSKLAPGTYRLVHFVTTELAAGDYTIGFAFSDVGGETERSLYWHDAQLPFAVERPGNSTGVGNANCMARMVIEPISLVSVSNSIQDNSQPNQQLAA